MVIDDILKEKIISQSRLVLPEPVKQGEWSVALRKHNEVSAQLIKDNATPVARVICELRGTFGSKVAIPTSYTIYEEKDLPDGGTETVHNTYRIMGKSHSFFLGGYTIRNKEGKRIEQGTMDEDGERHPFRFL
jgi:hypothetical protein